MQKKEIIFQNIGKNVETFNSYDEMINYSGLNYEVAHAPVYSFLPENKEYNRIEGKRLIYNKNTGQPINVMTDSYKIIQNADAFSIIKPFFGDIKPVWSGAIDNGAVAFMQCSIGKTINISGDKINRYLFIVNSHDGSSSLKISFSPVRQACDNMLVQLMRVPCYASIKHTTNASAQIFDVESALIAEKVYARTMEETFLKLRDYRITQNQIEYVINTVVGNEETQENTDITITVPAKEISSRKKNLIEKMKQYVKYGVGQEYHENSALWLFNGISSFYQNEYVNKNSELQLKSVLNGNVNRKSLIALKTIEELCQ
jgi:hypothetical protein